MTNFYGMTSFFFHLMVQSNIFKSLVKTRSSIKDRSTCMRMCLSIMLHDELSVHECKN